MMIPVGRRRLVLTPVAPPRPAAPEVPAALGASDAELVRLSARQPVDLDRAQWEARALMYGPRLP